jgi:lipoprotein-anchoring transpeptidase ErfK/SrfK
MSVSCARGIPRSVRHRSFIAVVAVLAVLFAAAVGVVVLDSRADGKIAAGVRVSGVPVGGLTAAQARAKLHKALLAPLGAPIVVHHDKKTWTLDATKARISANIGAMVHEAMERGQRGSMFSRAWRELSGGELDADLPMKVSFSRVAVRRLVTRVEGSLNRQPKDASIDYSAGGVSKTPGQKGRALRAEQLEDQILHAVARAGAARTFLARTRQISPKVTTGQLADKYPSIIVVDRAGFTLRLYRNLELAKTYPIAVGRQGLETPAGLYDVQGMQVNPSWHVPNSAWAGKLAGQVIPPGPDDPIKARWIGFNGGAGIHGTDADSSIGTAASHGCIRMHIPDVIDLYKQVSVGAPVYVA